MNKLLTLDFLKGYRTIIAAAVIALLTFLKAIGKIDEGQYASIVGLLTSIGLLAAANHEPPKPS